MLLKLKRLMDLLAGRCDDRAAWERSKQLQRAAKGYVKAKDYMYVSASCLFRSALDHVATTNTHNQALMDDYETASLLCARLNLVDTIAADATGSTTIHAVAVDSSDRHRDAMRRKAATVVVAHSTRRLTSLGSSHHGRDYTDAVNDPSATQIAAAMKELDASGAYRQEDTAGGSLGLGLEFLPDLKQGTTIITRARIEDATEPRQGLLEQCVDTVIREQCAAVNRTAVKLGLLTNGTNDPVKDWLGQEFENYAEREDQSRRLPLDQQLGAGGRVSDRGPHPRVVAKSRESSAEVAPPASAGQVEAAE